MKLSANYPTTHALLQISLDNADERLIDLYINKISLHNEKVVNDPFPNSGFDLFFPNDEIFDSVKTKFVSMDLKAQMLLYNPISQSWDFSGYGLYPRSSIGKTSLLLANNVGIIDSGYRGNIIGGFRNLSEQPYQVNQHDRLLQICAPDLRPILVEIVENSELEETSRQEGGFGSTGK
jgi:dUTP pyrophosphatase